MIPFHDSPRARTFPYVNLALIGINFAVFFYQVALSQMDADGGLTELDRFIYDWGSIPACMLDSVGVDVGLTARGEAFCARQPDPRWTPFTSIFMHAGWLHITGNMLFLWIFGDNVEDRLGHALYAVFYVLTGLIASFTQAFVADWTGRDLLVPAVGASGAIAGVMGAYIVLFPRATVAVIIPFFFFLPFPVPALVLVGVWFAAQVFSGAASLGADAAGAGGGIAYFAHIGGFVAGAGLVNAFMLLRPRRRGPPRAVRRPGDFW
jgi:membrane associated rhomboid family serine protease